MTLTLLSGLTITKERSHVDIDGASRRDFIKQTSLAALIASLDPFALAAEPLALASDLSARAATNLIGLRVSLLSLLGREFDRNTLKLFKVTSDPVSNRVFVAGILSQYVSILDATTHQGLATVDTGITLNSYKYIAVDNNPAIPVNRLYVRDTLNSTLSSVDLGTGLPIKTVPLPPGLLGAMAAANGLVYITTNVSGSGFRVYDGGTLVEREDKRISSMGNALLSIVHDPTANTLYLLDSSDPLNTPGTGRIFTLPLDTLIPTATTFVVNGTAPPGRLARSRASGRFYVLAAEGIIVLTSAGATVHTLTLPKDATGVKLEFQDMAFNEIDRRLLVLFLDPANQSANRYSATGGHLYAHAGDTLSGTDLSSATLSKIASFGKKPHSIYVNSLTGKFYCPAGDESTVWNGTKDSNAIGSLRIGDSIEGMVASPADGTVYMNSRLGGSHLVAYNPVSSTATSFTAGTWPTGMAINPAGTQLVVLNAWDSSMSVFSLPARTLDYTIPIGLPIGTTDRLPDFAVDFTRQRAYASYPEFGQVAVVDLAGRKALTPFTVDRFATGDIDGGPNQIQIAVCESKARLHVMSPSLMSVSDPTKPEPLLEVYDISGEVPSRVKSHTLPLTVVQTSGRPLWKLLFVDDALGRVFVEGIERDAETGDLTSRQLSSGQKVFAADSVRNLYWAGALENSAINIYAFDRTSLALVSTYGAGAADVLAPQLELDAARGRLYVSHLVSAQFESYTLPVTFTDDPLVAGKTTIKGVHVTEMRTAINTVRARYGLASAVWTDTITAQTTAVKAVHMTEMRTALAAVYTARGVALPVYTNAITAGSTPIKAVDVTELRAAILAIQ